MELIGTHCTVFGLPPTNFTHRIAAMPSGSFPKAERTDLAEIEQSSKISRNPRLKVSRASRSIPSFDRTIFSHGHVLVNGKKVNIPSYSCKPGDVVTVAAKARSQALANRFVELAANATAPEWLEQDANKLSAKVSRIPTVEEIAPIVNVQLIVELYSR